MLVFFHTHSLSVCLDGFYLCVVSAEGESEMKMQKLFICAVLPVTAARGSSAERLSVRNEFRQHNSIFSSQLAVSN